MGRHSAPEDDEPSDVPTRAAVDLAPGRHEIDDGDADAEADADHGDVAVDEDGAASEPQPKPQRKSRPETGTHGDLRLLRERPALRARCAAAAIVPFVLYTAVLAVIGRADIYLLWVWIPTVTAGIAVGGFLDAAHRHDGKSSVDD
jgi:hypothetical protein